MNSERFENGFMESGIITNIQRYSLHDGPGIRTTVFLKGCPLICLWCHNPEGLAVAPEVIVVETRCMRCGECVRVCPAREPKEHAQSERDAFHCRVCGACVAACPTGARQLVGRRMSVEEVMREVMKDRIFYDESGGGVTFSGGEPLLQAKFLIALLAACRKAGIRAAVDTCGAVPREDLLAVAPLTDLFLYDIKLMDEQRHIEYAGASNAGILANLKALAAVHENIGLRVPIVPGVNDREDELLAIAELAASMPSVRQVNLLPYHATGVPKFRRLGLDYRLEGVQPPAREAVEALAARVAAGGVCVKVGG